MQANQVIPDVMVALPAFQNHPMFLPIPLPKVPARYDLQKPLLSMDAFYQITILLIPACFFQALLNRMEKFSVVC